MRKLDLEAQMLSSCPVCFEAVVFQCLAHVASFCRESSSYVRFCLQRKTFGSNEIVGHALSGKHSRQRHAHSCFFIPDPKPGLPDALGQNLIEFIS